MNALQVGWAPRKRCGVTGDDWARGAAVLLKIGAMRGPYWRERPDSVRLSIQDGNADAVQGLAILVASSWPAEHGANT